MNPEFNSKYGTIIQHQGVSGFDLDKVADELYIKKENIVKAIILESKDLKPIVCIIRVVDRLNNKLIKKLYTRNFSFMSEEHLSQIDLTPGSIPPFIGFNLNFKTYIDSNLSLYNDYFGSGGSIYNACKFNISNYIELGAEVKNLTTN